MAAAKLSFLGLSDARSFFSHGLWLAVFLGLLVTLTVLSINFLAETLRNTLDMNGCDRSMSVDRSWVQGT